MFCASAPCPVWLVRPEAPTSYRRILAAVDVERVYPPPELGTRHRLNRQTLEMATGLALIESAEPHVVHARDAVGEDSLRHGIFTHDSEALVDVYVEQVRRQHAADQDRPDLYGYLLKGSACQAIPTLAKQIDCSVLAIKPPGFTTPVNLAN